MQKENPTIHPGSHASCWVLRAVRGDTSRELVQRAGVTARNRSLERVVRLAGCAPGIHRSFSRSRRASRARRNSDGTFIKNPANSIPKSSGARYERPMNSRNPCAYLREYAKRGPQSEPDRHSAATNLNHWHSVWHRRSKLSDGGHGARRLQPRRPTAVRCSAC